MENITPLESDSRHSAKRRLELNRQYQRNSRQRKLAHLASMEANIIALEAENQAMQIKLRSGAAGRAVESKEKKVVLEKLRELVNNSAPIGEIKRQLEVYTKMYTDYGPSRRKKIQYHLERMTTLLAPTPVTKMCLYSVDVGPQDSGNSTADKKLTETLVDVLGLSREQQKELLRRRGKIRQTISRLETSLDIVEELRNATEKKNSVMEGEINELSTILNSRQVAKFILWVNSNPAFMYMLDKLLDNDKSSEEVSK